MLMILVLSRADIVYLGNDDDKKKSSDEEEEDMETENDRVPTGKWHPILETRKREVGFRLVMNFNLVSRSTKTRTQSMNADLV